MRFSLFVLLITTSAPCQVRQQDQVARLLADMTLEDKVGQMTQLALGAVSRTVGNATTQHALDPEKLRHAIVDRKVGSILNVSDIAFDLGHWRRVHAAIRDNTAKTRLKIPVVYGIDAVHGANYTRGATLFPHNLGMAATWSEELVRAAAEVTARDV
ncbi:MAG: beta-glucosidase, partial [Planctomycetes bacterium]|nr:beta-glucosidase [Planctomycetota bacterium]